MIKKISSCRISGSKNLVRVLSLGEQYLTGVFPKSTSEKITKGPLNLVWNPDSELLQLEHSYDLDEMYGENYGYRSGLNNSMVNHLTHKIQTLEQKVALGSDDLVLDIGSNDATSLKAYTKEVQRVGMDPTGKKFIDFYTDGIELIADFFSASEFQKTFGSKKAKIITSIAMFYDLESPKKFVEDIAQVLADDGIWHFEQSYMPSMLRTNSYDTICHEHLEFYSFKVVKNLLEDCGLKVVDVEMNAVNGGSFAITAAKKENPITQNTPLINWTLQQEVDLELHTEKPYRAFEQRVFQHRKNLLSLIESLVADGKKIIGYGASTKGNVLLQFCNIGPQLIPAIAEVNPDKFGCYTPGTHIPIISEQEARAMKPDYFFVLPWHFKHSILEREKEFRKNGGKFIFPLPEIEII